MVNHIERRTVDVETAAQILGLSRTTAYKLATSGELPGVIRLGRRLLVSVDALEALLRGELPLAAADQDHEPAGTA